MQFCTQADLERALGGQTVLLQLVDPNTTGNINDTTCQAFITDFIDEASNELASYIEPRILLSALTAPFPRILVLRAADVAAYYAYTRGTRRLAIPDDVKEGYDKAISWAQTVGAGRAGLGVSPKMPLDPPAEMVDPQQGAIPAGFSFGTDDWEMNTQPVGGAISIAGFRRAGFR
jgi:phage gp36-like protein